MEIRGRDLISGLPKTIKISSTEVREAYLETVNTIVDEVIFKLVLMMNSGK